MNNQWIKDLKPGDKVFIDYHNGRGLRTVEKITPAGNVKVNGLLFDQYGRQRGGDTWSRCYLSEATPEEIENFRKETIIQKALSLMKKTTKLSAEQAEAIIKLLTVEEES